VAKEELVANDCPSRVRLIAWPPCNCPGNCLPNVWYANEP